MRRFPIVALVLVAGIFLTILFVMTDKELTQVLPDRIISVWNLFHELVKLVPNTVYIALLGALCTFGILNSLLWEVIKMLMEKFPDGDNGFAFDIHGSFEVFHIIALVILLAGGIFLLARIIVTLILIDNPLIRSFLIGVVVGFGVFLIARWNIFKRIKITS